MNRLVMWAFVVVMIVFGVVPALAQTAQAPAKGWMAYVAQLTSALLPLLIPFVVTMIRSGMQALPPWLLPVVSVVVGALLDVVTAWLSGGAPSSWGVLSGLAATGLHQVKRQLYDKQS